MVPIKHTVVSSNSTQLWTLGALLGLGTGWGIAWTLLVAVPVAEVGWWSGKPWTSWWNKNDTMWHYVGVCIIYAPPLLEPEAILTAWIDQEPIHVHCLWWYAWAMKTKHLIEYWSTANWRGEWNKSIIISNTQPIFKPCGDMYWLWKTYHTLLNHSHNKGVW